MDPLPLGVLIAIVLSGTKNARKKKLCTGRRRAGRRTEGSEGGGERAKRLRAESERTGSRHCGDQMFISFEGAIRGAAIGWTNYHVWDCAAAPQCENSKS